jgi:hypothetical protein
VILYQRSLGPWTNDIPALYDEMHAHLVGAALPEPAGRFMKAERLRSPEQAYRQHRLRYLGPAALNAVLEAASRLDRTGGTPLADRYFPELALAWRAAQVLHTNHKEALNPALLDYDCIAVDECQDLTPLESYVVIALARLLNRQGTAPLLLAGDEAQTVRPTDFEWAWLNDLLHSLLATPQEFKLPTNLRSPRRIADLVNRVWDYYGHLDKKDRPSGTGYAEIDDDSPDQVVYCTAAAGGELDALLADLGHREGLALVTFQPEALPEAIRSVALTPAEIKGLDFQSVCVLDAGKQLRRVVDLDRGRGSEIDALHKRLAIDQLRVALSRPAERLLWIDASPTESTVRDVQFFLRGERDIALPPVTPEALRKTLDEEELDLAERVQRCQHDARQLIDVKPDLAWSRAQQAVALVTQAVAPSYDMPLVVAAYQTLAEVCFLLAFRKARLSPELGRPDLFKESSRAARMAGKYGFANVINAIEPVRNSPPPERVVALADFVQVFARHRDELDGWLIAELTPHADGWIQLLDQQMHVGENAAIATSILPPFFDAMGLPDADSRRKDLTRRAIQILIKDKKHSAALDILRKLPKRQLALEAECLEQIGQFAQAAGLYQQLGDADKALRCFRAIPDFASALALVRQAEAHPARESLEWLASLDELISRRPEKFNRVMTMPEKKLLEQMLERALGVKRRQPVSRKATAQKAAAPKKPPAPPRVPRSTQNPYL